MKELSLERWGSSLAYSPDGKYLAVGSDETLLLLDTATSAVRRRLPGHYNHRGCVAFSPDSRYLASVSDGYGAVANRTIRVFEVASGTEIHAFKKELPIFAAAFSPDGSRLVVGGTDATALILDLHNLTGKQRRAQLTEKELLNHWERLASANAADAYEARTDLLHAPKSAVAFLAARLQPAPPVDADRVNALIKKLNHDAFQEREQATRELESIGDLVRGPIRKALAADQPLETRQRLQAILDKLDSPSPGPLRDLRVLEVLERIATPEALEIIEKLGKGNPDGRLTSESRSVTARLRKRNEPLPEIPVARRIPSGSPEIPAAGPALRPGQRSDATGRLPDSAPPAGDSQ